MTVSADVEMMKINEMPTQDAPAACDASDVTVTKERLPPHVFESEPGITKPQESTAGTTIATPAPGAEIASKVKELATELQTARDVISPAEVEVSTEVVEGEVAKLSEEEHSEDRLDDGTTVRKTVTTTKHVRPLTTIVRKIGGAEEQHKTDKLLGTEVDEQVTILEPGVLQLRDDQLENETQVEESEDKANDGTWLKRKVTTLTVKCKKTPATQGDTVKPSSSSVPRAEQFAIHRRAAELPPSSEVPKGSLDLNAPPQPSASVHQKDVTKPSLEQQSPHLPEVDSARPPESETRPTEVASDRKSEDDQSKLSQSKPTIIPVKLTKLEPLPKDRTSATADASKQADAEQKSSIDERDTTKSQQPRSGSPSLSVVRLTKLEPLSFGGSASVEATGETTGSSLPQRAPDTTAQQVEQPSVIQPTTEEMIVPVPSSRHRPAAWQPTTTAPLDDDLDLKAAVDEMPVQVEQTADQFAVAPSNITPAVEQEITENLTTAPGSLIT